MHTFLFSCWIFYMSICLMAINGFLIKPQQKITILVVQSFASICTPYTYTHTLTYYLLEKFNKLPHWWMWIYVWMCSLFAWHVYNVMNDLQRSTHDVSPQNESVNKQINIEINQKTQNERALWKSWRTEERDRETIENMYALLFKNH